MNLDAVKQMTDCCDKLNSIIAKGALEEEKNLKNELEKEFQNLLAQCNPESDEEKKQLDEINRNFNKLLKQYASAIFQLYQTRDLERWEHYAIKLKICEELEQLSALPQQEIGNAAQRIVQLRNHWQELGSVPHDKADEIRERYHKVNEIMKPALDQYFKELEEKRSHIDNAKKEIVEQIKKLAENPNFQDATPKIKALQTQWKELGIGHIKTDRTLFKEFKAVCDNFFSARNSFFRERKAAIGDATARKNALIEAAAALDPKSPDLKRNAQNLYSQWREIPYAGKNDQNLYAKFKAAVDNAFNVVHEEEKAKIDEFNNWCAALDELSGKLNSGELDTASAEEQYKHLIRQFNTMTAGGRAPAATEAKCRGARRNFENIMQRRITDAQLDSARNRMEAEKQLAQILAADDCSAWQEAAAFLNHADVKNVEKIACMHLDERMNILRENSKQRKFILGNWECKLGMNNSIDSNVELLALALENAIRDNFAAETKNQNNEAKMEDFCHEFFSVTVADPDDIPEIYTKFDNVINFLTKKS